MPKKRYERRELSHKWEDIGPLLKDTAQMTYEVIRPVVLFGVSPKERAEETGISKSSIYYKANLFDQAGMASLFPPMPPPDLPKQDKRALPPPIRQAIVDAHAEYPELSLHDPHFAPHFRECRRQANSYCRGPLKLCIEKALGKPFGILTAKCGP